MKKLESTITNMVIVLVGVALVTGSILAYVNHVTEEPIKLQAEKTLADGIKAVMGGVELTVAKEDTVKQTAAGKELTFIIHEAVGKDNKPIGAAVESTTGGFGGDLKVLVGFDTDGNILGYTILQHSETPGLGSKMQEWFRTDKNNQSVIGRTLTADGLKVTKDGGDVDAITAATISSRAFLDAINRAYSAYKSADMISAATSNNNEKGGNNHE